MIYLELQCISHPSGTLKSAASKAFALAHYLPKTQIILASFGCGNLYISGNKNSHSNSKYNNSDDTRNDKPNDLMIVMIMGMLQCECLSNISESLTYMKPEL